MENDPLTLAESIAAIAEKTGWSLDYITGTMSQRQLMLMLRGWNRMSQRMRDGDAESSYDFPDVTPVEQGGFADPSWMLTLAQERGFQIVEKE